MADDRSTRSTTDPTLASEDEQPRTPMSATFHGAGVIARADTPSSRRPLPAVKGTMRGIESPRRELFSPASTLRASEPYSPATSTHGGSGSISTARPSDVTKSQGQREPSIALEPTAPVLVFRADPRMTTCFDGLPEGSEAVKAKFGVV